jgi:predicted ATPase
LRERCGETEGNPFFLAEVLRSLASEGRLATRRRFTVESVRTGVPEGVREVIDRRLDRLSADRNWVLTVAAVVGREFRITLLAPVAGLDTDRLLETIEEAETARIVVAAADAPGWYRFTHALIRETLYDELPTARRARLHRRVGEALQELYAGAPEPHLAELAHHFLQALPAGEIEPAVEYARRAGTARWLCRL